MSNFGTPTWRVDKDREREERECEERARADAVQMIKDPAAMFRILEDMEEIEQVWLAATLVMVMREETERTPTTLSFGVEQMAYRRALAAERSKAGFP